MVLQREESKGETGKIERIKAYMKKVEGEIEAICTDLMQVLDKDLIPGATAAEGKVFYRKMKGDYYRYWAESLTGDKKAEIGEKGKAAYESALELAEKEMPHTHPVRLGLALNFSVFHYEILSDPVQACKLAKAAFDAALPDLEKLEEEQYKEAATIMQLLRDNLSLWTSADEEAGEPAEKEKEKEAPKKA